MNSDNELKNLIDKEYEKVNIPEGLEDRLSAKIDAMAEERHPFAPAARWISIAAALAIVAVSATLIATHSGGENVRLADTCQTPDEAYAETEKALSMISDAYGKGMKHVEAQASKVGESNATIKKELYLNKNHKK